MGRQRRYASLEEANRDRNAKRRQQRANASANHSSGKYEVAVDPTGLSVSIEQPSGHHSAVELRYKSKVSIDTDGVNNQDVQHVTPICLHSKVSSISHASCNTTTKDCAETAVSGMHECLKEASVESTILASTSNSGVDGYSGDACSLPIITDRSVLSVRPGRKCQSVRQGDTTQKRRKMLARDPLSVIATEPDILLDIPDCQHCKAKKFQLEPPGFCCSSGEIQLLPTEMPRELMMLYLEESEEAVEFRRCVRSYNNMFAFTSIGVNCDKSLNESYNGIYTFRIQGQMYHFINQLIPNDGDKARNVQLYFFDTDHETVNRLAISNRFRQSLITKLDEILRMNPYSAFFRALQNLSNIDNYKIVLESSPAVDQKVFNKPTVSQVGAVWADNCDNEHVTSKHIQVYGNNGKTQIIKHYFSCYDPLQYPLVFASGEPGWHQGIKRIVRTSNARRAGSCEEEVELAPCAGTTPDQLINAENSAIRKNKRKHNMVSCREYYCYKLQIRENDRSMLLHIGRLLQQYVVDMYVKIESTRLDFYRLNDNQTRLRSELYQSLIDSLAQGESSSSNVGTRIILPGSFIGGPRDMRRRYMDAMSLVQRYGKPDIFLTMTCNRNWPEIKDLLLQTDKVENRPDLISRVFRAKLEQLKNELFKKNIFGEVAAYTYVIEFQKRGLPHAHFLIILKQGSKMYSPEAYDRIVCAELPDINKHEYLHGLVVKHMMHGPCGTMNPACACMRKHIGCKDRYPKQFRESTIHTTNSYPLYRRRNDKKKVKVRGHYLDNCWVVPYCPYLLAKFNCHMNVEICSTIQAVKYIYKYIYKGHDRVLYQLSDIETNSTIDEIKNYVAARWVSPPEAMWRIFGFDLNQIHPSVMTLQVHLENKQPVTFPEKSSLHSVVKNQALQKTMLTEFFSMNRYDNYAKNLNCVYVQFPEYFRWNQQSKIWEQRKQREVIGRLLGAHPSEGERYYLRILLMHVRKPTSFTDLRTVNGHVSASFHDAADEMGLLQTDNASELCLSEAVAYKMPNSLRQLFAAILVYCSPKNPTQLWLEFKDFLSEDIRRDSSIPIHLVEAKVLQCIDNYLQSMGKSLADYRLSTPLIQQSQQEVVARDIETERNIIVTESDLRAIDELNKDQMNAYEQILDVVTSNGSTSFFVDGPGGTGKTFLYRALLAKIRSTGGIALATATSGVAASILPGGRTAHSRFKIPLHDDDSKSCRVGKQTAIAQLIRDARLIIWDEASMAKRKSIERFDEMMRDVTGHNLLFGGKTVVFGGDFRQTLPVVTRGYKEDIISASLVMSPIWNQLTKLRLEENMRARSDKNFSDFLLRIGNGTEISNHMNEIKIPTSINLPFVHHTSSVETLVSMVFPDMEAFINNPSSIVNRAILMTRNDFVHEINDMLINKFPGSQQTYLSFDEALDTSHQLENQDFLNTLTPKGLPPHELKLKKNCPVMLIRNINPTEGLSNGTRLICKEFGRNVIHADISFGTYTGKSVFIPRIPLQCSDDELCSVPFKRIQFPLRLCFAMTINKAQGQTLDYVGLYLKEPVFSHGQLYVALSRGKTANNVKVLIRPLTFFSEQTDYTKNIVYKEVLSMIGLH